MGFFWPGLPDYLLPWAAGVLSEDAHFIETGTFKGDTAAAAAAFFSQVDTIELDPVLARKATERLSTMNVACHRGDSRDVLPGLLQADHVPLFIWLDAHYSGGITAGVEDPCPLLDELRLILDNRRCANTILAIDDARLCVRADGYPRLDEVAALLAGAGWPWILVDDVVIAATEERLNALLERRTQWRTTLAGSLGGIWRPIQPLIFTSHQRGRLRYHWQKMIRGS